MTSIGEFNCIFCKETFDDKETLQIHFRKHGDPNYNQQRRFGDAKMSDVKSNEPAEMVSCDVCPEVFTTISKAITHKHKVHPDHDAKYFCPWCGKLFTMKHLYNKHLQANHSNMEQSDGKTFRCDCCEVAFFVAPAMLCHNKFFHRQDTDLPSVGLSKKQKLYNQEAIPIYYCPFCGEEYDNKVNLHKHMGDDHGDENQNPDEVLRCPLCEALFYHLDAYEIHLTFHSNEDYYRDRNEMTNEITEFSLETVAPITEKVENFDQPSTEGEDTLNALGVDQFLQLAMGDSNDNGLKKNKKHKKHKKSKKSAITLDEFLNMNKDVFGEELDVHGVEEVPTTVVARRLKANKKNPQKPKKTDAKCASDLQKLKLQGIVVKKQPVNNTSASRTSSGKEQNKILKFSQNLIAGKKTCDAKAKINPNSLSTSDEVLSKLLNQSNNQIKIVKKHFQSTNSACDDQVNDDCPDGDNDYLSEVPENENSLKDNSPGPDQNIDTEDTENVQSNQDMKINTLDFFNKSQDSGIISKLDNIHELKTKALDSGQYKNLQTDIEGHSNIFTNEVDTGTDQKTVDISPKFIENYRDTLHENEDINHLGELDSKDGCDQENFKIFTKSDEDEHNKELNNSLASEHNSPNKSLSTLKHLSHLITVKPVSNDKNTLGDKGNATSTGLDSGLMKQLVAVPPTLGNSEKAQINQNPPTNMSQNVFKNLNKNITIKSFNQPSDTCNYNEDDECTEDEEDLQTSRKPVTRDVGDKHAIVTKDNNKSQVIKQSNLTKELEVVSPTLVNTEKAQLAQNPPTNVTQKSIDVLKNLHKNITIKSFTQPSDTCKYNEDEDEFTEDDKDLQTSSKPVARGVGDSHGIVTTDNNQLHINKQSVNMLKNFNVSMQNDIHPSKVINKSMIENSSRELVHDKTQDQINAILLKRLSNVTAKPFNVSKTLNKEFIEKQPNRNTTNIPKKLATKFLSKEIDEGIEIFNIDDSDSDNDKEIDEIKRYTDVKISDSIKPKQSLDSLKSLGKHITIKNMRQETTKTNMVKEDSAQESWESKIHTFSENKQFVTKTLKSHSDQPKYESETNKNSDLRNFILNLGNNLTVKSRNSQDNTQDSNIEHSDDSEAESYSGKVKITEIENDDLNENEIDTNLDDEAKDNEHIQKVNVQSPDDSFCDREGSMDEDMTEEESDFENQIKANRLTKSTDSFPMSNMSSTSLNTLKGISKDITIRSVNENKSQSRINETTENINSSNKEFALKPSKQARAEPGNTGVIPSRMEKFNNASNKINTINKEVTVKTFQTQTVIQEITTTVTKTIRTVNQTVNQVQNQSSSKTIIPPNRIVGVRPSIHVGRNLQGVTVGQRPPNIGCKIRNASPSVRPVIRNPMQPSNQLISVRPRLNTPRQSTPRMPCVQKLPTTPNQQRPTRSLKISPNAITSSLNKRPSSEEANGPFSCFKKPRETLFPVSDLPNTCNNSNFSNIHYSSSSQCSKSNVTTSKVLKGNSVVTSTHMKSEASATSQQLSKLSNVCGLKIVKTNQKHEHVQEKSETSSKRTTLEAIEKLQKQGLLVKKPRLDDDEVSNHSEPDDDYNEEYSSTEENDN